MDVTNIISKLRSERDDIDQAIRFLEHDNGNLGGRTHRHCDPLREGIKSTHHQGIRNSRTIRNRNHKHGQAHDGS
jgi:hypothetical protein